MDRKSQDKKDQVRHADKASECGAPHTGCPATWPGTCDREAGHDSSHHCDKCNGTF